MLMRSLALYYTIDATTRSVGPLRTRDYCSLQTVVVNVNRFLNKANYVLRSSRRPAPLTTEVWGMHAPRVISCGFRTFRTSDQQFGVALT